MPARSAPAHSVQRHQRELADLQLVVRARNGDQAALDGLIRRYTGFVRLKASSYFLAGGDPEDLIQEGLIGLCKAIRDFRHDKETSFRSFAELCVTRQIITAIKTATRYKHQALNNYVSFSNTPAGQDPDSDCTLGDALPGSHVDEPSVQVISTEELKSLVFCLGTGLSRLEGDALRMYLERTSYEDMGDEVRRDTQTNDYPPPPVEWKIGCEWGSSAVGDLAYIGGCAFAPNASSRFSYAWDAAAKTLTMTYAAGADADRRVDAVVSLRAGPAFFDLHLTLTNRAPHVI